MNQILVVEKPKKQKTKKTRTSSGPADIHNILKFFAIFLIIFGISYIGQGSYGVYREAKGKNRDNMPVVNIARVNDTVKLEINATNEIDSVIYSWNTAEETKIPVEGIYVDESIILPMENSILNVKIEEKSGRMLKYQKEFLVEGLDLAKPTIEITEGSTKGDIKITATDDIEMAYIKYKINDGQEQKVEKSELESTVMNYVLRLGKGESKITVTAVDTSGNEETIEKTIVITGKTTIDARVENGQLVILANDPDGIKSIEVNLNGTVYGAKDIDQKNIRVPMPIQEGTNTVKITVTNVNSLVTTGAKEFEYHK